MRKNKINTDILDSIIIGRVEPNIYAFITQTVPNYLKVGDTYRPVRIRLDEWRSIFPNLKHIYSHSARIDKDTIFRDMSVHYFLEHIKNRYRLQPNDIPSIPYYSREFFKNATSQDIDEAIEDIHNSALHNDGRYKLYSSDHLPKTFSYTRGPVLEPRDNQKEVINNFETAWKLGRKNLLMFAVMRFGKSFTSMCCAKKMDAKLVLVVSAKADVKDEWKKTVESIGNFKGYIFADKKDLLKSNSFIRGAREHGNSVVLFLTLQDLQGDEIKEAHQEVFALNWDLLLVDETHFGARAEHYGKFLLTKKETTAEAERQMKDVDTLDKLDGALKEIKTKITIHLSGTPYRILMGGEFAKEDIISFVQFSDIADAQNKWIEDHKFDEETVEWDNPYFGFPQMIRFAFTPNKSSLKRIAQLKASGSTASFSELFKPQSLSVSKKGYNKFVHEDVVLDFLKIIDGIKNDSNVLGFLDNDRIKKGKLCHHMVFVLPYCASCDAMETLIKKNSNIFRFLSKYEILNISGVKRESRFNDTADIKRYIAQCESEGKKTITLTVNRMLTGNTVPQWDTMLFLKQSSSPEEYDQAIFRLQNPFVEEYEDNGSIIKFNMKPQTILVDFDPERIFRLQERKSQIYNVNTDNNGNSRLKERIETELRISPIITLDHNKLREVTASNILDEVRNYAETRSVLDEAAEMPIDFSLLNNSDLRAVVSSLNEIDSKKGLHISAHFCENGDDDVESSSSGESSSQSSGSSSSNASHDNDDANNEEISMSKKFATYYALILFFSFLTDDKVTSLEDIINVMNKSENNIRICRNLGLKSDTLKFLQSKSNGFALSKLDYKIHNTNSLNHDINKEPLERVKTALTKFGRMSESEIVTPIPIAERIVSLLPDDVFSKGPVLDIASKQGEFTIALLGHYGDSVSDKIYSVCTSKLAYEFTRKVYSLLSLPVNHIFDSFTSYDLIHKDINKNYNIPKALIKMKFSAIVGNPPYQEVVAIKNTTNGQKRSSSIFQHFQAVSDKLGVYSSLIYPGARWIHRSGKGLERFGHDQINDPHLTLLEFYPDSTDIFGGVGIADGLSIVLKNKQKATSGFKYIYSKTGDTQSVDVDNPGDSLLPLNPSDTQIVKQIDRFIKKHKLEYLHGAVLSQKLFGIESDFVQNNPDKVRECSGDDLLDKFDPETEVKLFTNDKAGKAGRSRWYIANRSVITTGTDQINRWKVIVSSANAGGQKRSNQIAIVDNHSAFGRSRVALRSFETEAEAKNFYEYCRSELIRFAFLLTDESLTSLAKKVPDLLDYTDNNKFIDFSGDVNEQLYKLFKIDEKRRKHIRSVLAAKENNKITK